MCNAGLQLYSILLNLMVFVAEGSQRPMQCVTSDFPSLCRLFHFTKVWLIGYVLACTLSLEVMEFIYVFMWSLFLFCRVSMTNYSNRKSSSDQEYEKAIVPKEEILDFELASDHAFPTHFGVCL